MHIILSGQTLSSGQETKVFVQDNFNVLAATFYDEDIERSSHEMSSTLIYVATVWINR
jgi:hypothetical protein